MGRRRLLISVLVLVCLSMAVLIIALVRARARETPAQRILAINAAHAVPPEDNAATLYGRVLATELEAHLMPPAPGVREESNSVVLPVLSDEERVGMLLEAARRPQCYFPAVCQGAGPVEAMRWALRAAEVRKPVMTRWAQSLLRAAFDDLEQGRLDAAKEKLHGVVQMATHLRQQPARSDFFTAGAVEHILWSSLCEFIVDHDATDKHLAAITEIMPSLADAWEAESAEMRQVEMLLDTRSAWGRLKSLISGGGPQRDIEQCAQMYRAMICERRGTRILLELRRRRNESGRWPDMLGEIKGKLPPEACSNPLGADELVYEPEPGGFRLYAIRRGHRRTVDGASIRPTYPVWPRRGILKWVQERQ